MADRAWQTVRTVCDRDAAGNARAALTRRVGWRTALKELALRLWQRHILP